MNYIISVCPECKDGPLVFDPDGLDRDEGMNPRARCENGHIVIQHEALELKVNEAA